MVKPNSEQVILDLVILCTLGLLFLSARPHDAFPHIWRACPSCLQASSSVAETMRAALETGRSLAVAFETMARLLASILGL